MAGVPKRARPAANMNLDQLCMLRIAHYAFIINHYEPGDRIFLIGFSGTYTVRSLANLLMLCGVPTKTPTGPLMRFRAQVDDIATEAVTVVLEHGAGYPRD
ncbi:hypothetical protein AOQ73_24470 [Bradyrhizobium pachyrhizi]|nr:hypothetical protein AOQ73_24470 [Bradyrhizobium pachyrhizi]